MIIESEKKAGFTLVELLLSISVIVILSALSMPFISAFQSRNNLDVALNTIAQAERRAQTSAMAVERDADCTGWGLSVQSSGIVLYCGTSFSGRNSSFDENYDIASNINISSTGGAGDISYSKVSGLPNNTGTITLTQGSDSRSISINAKGVITY
ncbi:MAG: Tfp pilus assembly protein FimT/FimU [Thiobacillus sp.]